MEQDFQTSFIPKKPMIEERAVVAKPVGLFTLAAIFILLTVILGSGGLYFYQVILNKNISQMENALKLAESRFEPSKIVQLQVLDKRLRASEEVLSKHVAISPIFKLLESITMKSVQYTSFTYMLSDNTTVSAKTVGIQMNGIAVGYKSIALQSDLFSGHREIIDPVFSNLSLDDKGNVMFDLTFSVDPNLVNYKQSLQTETTPSVIPPADTSIPTNTSTDMPTNTIQQ